PRPKALLYANDQRQPITGESPRLRWPSSFGCWRRHGGLAGGNSPPGVTSRRRISAMNCLADGMAGRPNSTPRGLAFGDALATAERCLGELGAGEHAGPADGDGVRHQVG